MVDSMNRHNLAVYRKYIYELLALYLSFIYVITDFKTRTTTVYSTYILIFLTHCLFYIQQIFN